MKKKISFSLLLVLFTGLLLVGFLFFFSITTYQRVLSTGEELDSSIAALTSRQQVLQEGLDGVTEQVAAAKTAINYVKQKQQNMIAGLSERERERDMSVVSEEEEETTTKASVFSSANSGVFSSGE